MCNKKTEKQYVNDGETSYENKLYENALECYNEAILINNKSILAYILRGKALVFLNRYQDAICSFDIAINRLRNKRRNLLRKVDQKWLDKLVTAYVGKAVTLISLDRYSEALSVLNKAISLNDELPQAYFLRGIALYGVESYQNAVSEFDKAILLNEHYEEAHYGRKISLETLAELKVAFHA